MTDPYGTAPEPGRQTLPYRSDIDGLRAVAVLAVVLYHFGLPGLGGGFVGVDVFFVISGFLIGGLLWREREATGRIRLGAFYVRRFRRLAPAYFAMALVTTALGAALLLPFEFRELGKQLIAATVYLSNVLFYGQSGYFDSGAEQKPLLHTWSLAVEEQFYILLPLLFLLVARSRRALIACLATCWLASLAACIWLTPAHQPATFFLFPFRAWELLSGVLLAIWGCETGRRWRGPAPLSWLGLALVLAGVLLIPAGPRFPGMLALVPVAGTLLLLANGCGDNGVNRLLSRPGAVLVGRMSYSLYLWHWPVLSLSLYLRGSYSGLPEALGWMALAFGISWLSWRWIETPVRRLRVPGRTIVAGTALGSASVLGLGALLYLGDGIAGRFGPEARPHIAASADFLQDWSRCKTPADGPFEGLELCPIGPEGEPEFLVWGDSHVRALHAGLELAAAEAGTPALVIWRAGCPPLFDLRKDENTATPAQDAACAAANARIRDALSDLPNLRRLLLVGRWTYYASGTGVGLDAGNRITLQPTQGNAPDQAALLAKAATDTVAELLDHVDEVAVLRQPPEIARYDSRLAAREAALSGLPLAPAPVTEDSSPRDALEARIAPAEAPWRAMARDGAITWIDPWPRICDAAQCRALVDGEGWYFDNNHLTNTGARHLRDLLAPLLGRTGGQGS